MYNRRNVLHLRDSELDMMSKMMELFKKFVENRCPTFWDRVEEGGWHKGKKAGFSRIIDTFHRPRDWIQNGFPWETGAEGAIYWLDVHIDWVYIVDQEDKKKRDKITRLFEKFVENRCPTFWERIEEHGEYKDKEEFLRDACALGGSPPRGWVSRSLTWFKTPEGTDHWQEAHIDWYNIVEQEEEKAK